MFQKLNLQYMFSYSGLIPLIYIILDKYLFLQIKEEIILNFSLYYSLLIIVFIGSTNWNLKTKLSNLITIYGFSPSLIATIIVYLNLINLNSIYLFLTVIICFLVQLFFDYIFIYSKEIYKNSFYFLRLPLTLTICIMLVIIIY